MSKSSILSAIKRKTTEALKNFVHVEGQSIMKQVAAVGAKEAGVTDVHNDKFNGELGGAYFSVLTPTVKEDHWFVKKSALLEYIIVRTYIQVTLLRRRLWRRSILCRCRRSLGMGLKTAVKPAVPSRRATKNKLAIKHLDPVVFCDNVI
ncbi:unnamed protein product [Arabidopsis lyrata]|uniref:Predicted protein n=1 Tax=Arabidopsis lyrata subsp. lyrata TaxID=81972 RepID=D7KF54_ARALL|nr:predicted protein [Arabidopsis lyrata subsp. lyrata]CAH8251265.1 unnamed protein product [Arabidopsis lyrata]